MPNDDALSQASETTPRTDPMPIASALSALDPADDTHWTASGKPSVAAVSDIVGAPVTRADIDAAAPDLTRDAADPNAPVAVPDTPPADPASAEEPPKPLSDSERLAIVEDDLAYLRALFGWPTKEQG